MGSVHHLRNFIYSNSLLLEILLHIVDVKKSTYILQYQKL